jgi:REP element-mobilizing transposase RayT
MEERAERRSTRLRGFDYGRAGAYFVTVCTHERACILGEVKGDAVEPSWMGEIVQRCWDEIPAHYPTVEADAVIVMPNHLHGLLFFSAPVGATHASPGSPKLGSVVGSFKAAASAQINRQRETPGAPIWQRGFHEHVVRGDDDLSRIRRYIADNPAAWALDRENPLAWRG